MRKLQWRAKNWRWKDGNGRLQTTTPRGDGATTRCSRANSAAIAADGEPAEPKASRSRRALKRIRVAWPRTHLARHRRPARGHHRRRLLGLSYSIRFDSQPRERDRIYAFSQTHLDRRQPRAALRIFVDPKSFIYSAHDAGLRGDADAPGLQLHQPHSSKSCGCDRALDVRWNMRDQYVGDISDLLKLALLRAIAGHDRRLG